MRGRHEHYILDGLEPVPVDIWTWVHWFEADVDNRRIAWDQVGAITVSTVFLGLDHNFSDRGPPILYETMSYVENEDAMDWLDQANWSDLCLRSSNYWDALRNHEIARLEAAELMLLP